ncbi:hypothetical protein FN846DRAFT_911468 [Sphaerosporella brunnea]|uniref:Uncharacterized protein n=1 Tax=Sphaerosporella brunnea TaxID=1250544 RepID=A0A5J5EKF2_9PEZI|nr:hypothetical protein FN846DRAFT_911468 [Sphaerosporella brunnea]
MSLMWLGRLALWIPAYITLVFAADAAIRAYATPRLFKNRSLRRVSLMLVGVLSLLSPTIVPAFLQAWSEEGRCLGEIMMLVTPFSGFGVGISAALISVTTVSAVIVYINLSTKSGIEIENRVTASRELCFVAVSVVQWILLLPYFAVSAAGRADQTLSFMAAVVFNTSGLTASILHIYLHTTRTVISGPSSHTISNTRTTELADLPPPWAHEEQEYRPPAPPKDSPRSVDVNELQIRLLPADAVNLHAPSPHVSERSRFSVSTVGSFAFQRLGEEITTLMNSLLNANSSSSSSSSSSPSPSGRAAARLPFTPAPSNLHYVRSSFDSVCELRTQTPPTRGPCVRSLTPSRPSRRGVPSLNIGRVQNLGKNIWREELVKEVQEHTRTGSARSLFEAVEKESGKLGIGPARRG